MKDIAFLLNFAEIAKELQVRLGMPASQFLARLYELQYDEPLEIPEDGLRRLDVEAVEMARQRGKECLYQRDIIYGQLFATIMALMAGKESLFLRIEKNPRIQEYWRQCPMLQVVMEYMLKLIKEK